MPTSYSDSQAQSAYALELAAPVSMRSSSFQFSKHKESSISLFHPPPILKFVFWTNVLKCCDPSIAHLTLTNQVTNFFGSSSGVFALIPYIQSANQSNQRLTQVILLFFWLHLTVTIYTSSHTNAFTLNGRNLPLNVHSCIPQVYFLHNCLYV